MVRTGLSERLIREILDESEAKKKSSGAYDDPVLSDRQTRLRTSLAALGKSGDIDRIMLAERVILNTELVDHGNSRAMRTSLGNALIEHDAAVRMMEAVRDPERYKTVASTLTTPKNRVGGLPKDQARQYFKSQNARLLNLDKARLSVTEKAVLNERRGNLRIAEKGYTALQRKALGLKPEPNRDMDQDRGMGL